MANAGKDNELVNAARLFGVLAEPARLRILELLRDGSMCGRELARDLNLTPATTCHHLEKLELAKLLSKRRLGRRVYYSISDTDRVRAVRRSLAALANEESSPRWKPAPKRRNRKASKTAERTE